MFQQKHAYSAITVDIERLTSQNFEEEDLSGIPNLVDLIKLQSTGPSEAARSLRKKLKYGNVHMQLRALVILDALIDNAGPKFQRTFANEPLLERLRVCGSSDLSDPAVRTKCRILFRRWEAHANTPGLGQIARLHKQLPSKKHVVTQAQSKVVRETENPFGDDEEEVAAAQAAARRQTAGGSSQRPAVDTTMADSKKSSSHSSSFFGSSSKTKQKDKSKGGKRKGFNLEAERENMKLAIDDSSNASQNLLKILQKTDRAAERISENPNAVAQFEACKQLRRRILRYIHNVDNEEWLGKLLNENDVLVHALMSFEQMDHSIDADSDSDDEIAEQAHLYRMVQSRGMAAQANAGPAAASRTPSPGSPPRRQVPEEDDNDPFTDSHAIETPATEMVEPRWP